VVRFILAHPHTADLGRLLVGRCVLLLLVAHLLSLSGCRCLFGGGGWGG
jgi:phosphate starvation-inducible membrane PsiE